MKYKNQSLLLLLLVLSNQLFAQQFEKFSRFYDFNKKVTEWKLLAHYLYLYEYTDVICKRTDYYMKEESVKSIGFFTDTSCKTKIGQFTSYYPSKTLASKGAYLLNKKEGLWLSYYENGSVKDSSIYKNNNSVGNSYTWFRDSSVSVKREMDLEGNGNGKEISYWDNGKLDFEGNWLNGKRNGLWIYYHYNGNKSAEIVYENNKIVDGKCFDENGIRANICDIETLNSQYPAFKDGTDFVKYLTRSTAKIDIYWGAKDISASQTSVFVWIGFTVTKQGTLKDITIEHSSTASVNEQMIKLFKSMPLFNPVFGFNRKIEYHFVQRMEFRR